MSYASPHTSSVTTCRIRLDPHGAHLVARWRDGDGRTRPVHRPRAHHRPVAPSRGGLAARTRARSHRRGLRPRAHATHTRDRSGKIRVASATWVSVILPPATTRALASAIASMPPCSSAPTTNVFECDGLLRVSSHRTDSSPSAHREPPRFWGGGFYGSVAATEPIPVRLALRRSFHGARLAISIAATSPIRDLRTIVERAIGPKTG
jgi:hypothetical protein